MLDFDERDLLSLADRAGFSEVDLRLHVDIGPAPPRRWEVVIDSSANPRVPTLAEAMADALDPEEAERLTHHLKPLVEAGHGQRRIAGAYLWAVR
ncbi:MAG: hypothetical protein ACYDH5_13625 [Acidimicrobiales bacterium]